MKSKKDVFLFTAILLTGMMAVNSCTHPVNVAPDVSFSKNIVPIFNSSCSLNSNCHSGNGNKGNNIDLDSAAAYMSLINKQLINTTTPSASLLYVEVKSGIMPKTPYNHLAADQITNILNWIQQGAKNN